VRWTEACELTFFTDHYADFWIMPRRPAGALAASAAVATFLSLMSA
jgi:hypothetical protein